MLHLRRGFHVIEWMLAILKAGAAFVYLDPTSSKPRKEFILSMSEATVVVDDSGLDADSGWLARHPGKLLNHTSTDEMEFNLPLEVATDIGWSDLAYIIFTSGSTGEPDPSKHRQEVALAGRSSDRQ